LSTGKTTSSALLRHTRVDFQALAQGMAHLQLDTIDKLRAREDESNFPAGLVSDEATRHRPDALKQHE